jgi:hypothetical protein
VIVDLIVVGVAFAGVIFVVRWWITHFENRQSPTEGDSGFSMWSQDVYDGPRTSVNDASSSVGMAVASDWEREASRNAPEQNDAGASDMGSLDSRIETDSFSSSTDNSDFSSSSDMGGLDN